MASADDSSLYVKYRPTTFDAVVGQDRAVAALKNVIEKRRAQTFLFYGPSGTGKTTLARICCKELECSPRDIIEVDAATFSGIDSMRSVQQSMQYQAVGGGKSRAVIVDEAHGLSRQAWDSLLKAIEEPNKNAYWFLCTTNLAKVPTTIKTRAASFKLDAVREDALERIVRRVIKRENMDVPDGVIQVVCKEAQGSPRQALVNLALCESCKSSKEAAALLHSAQQSDPTIELCRFLMKGGSWPRVMAIINKMQDENPEGVRIVVCNYIGKALASAKSDRDATRLLTLLDAFSTSYNQSEGIAPLLLSVGRALYDGE